MSFSLESCCRIARPRTLVLVALTFAIAACGDSVTPTSPDVGADVTTLVPAGDEPLASAFAGGIPIGNFAQPVTQLGSIFNGDQSNAGPTALLRELQDIKSRGGKVVLVLSGSPKYYVDGAGNFSYTKWKERVNRYRGVNFRSYIEDGTVIGHYVIDEPNDPANWNGKPVPSSMVEEMARYSKSLWPGMATIVRAEPKHMASNHRYLDAAWAQYLYRRGNVNEYIKDVVADAQRRGLALIVGLNVIGGGNPNGSRMSASEIEQWGSAMLSSSYPCAFINWKYDANYFGSSGIRSAFSSLRRKAENRSTKSCKS
jgi:hypothetical protein